MTEIELYHPYDLWYEPSWLVRYYTIIGAGAIIVVIAVIAIYLFLRNRHRQKPCWYHALIEVEALKKTANLENHIFYAQLTTIIKKYLTQRYSSDFFSKTEEEIISHFKQNLLPDILESDLEKIFKGAIVIKFAHQPVDKTQIDEDIARSIRIIKNSIPTEYKRGAS